MMFAASILNLASEVEEIIMNFLIGVSKMFKISSEIKGEKASGWVFAFFTSSTHPGRRTIMFSLRARATLGGVLLQVKSLP